MSENFSKSLTGENNPFYGKHHSKEAKDKMKANHMYIKGPNNPLYGRHLSDERKRFLSEY